MNANRHTTEKQRVKPEEPPATEASDAAVVPYPMDTAPKDGTIVRLLVRFTDGSFEDVEPGVATWTIGQNGADHHPEDDEWLFAGWNWEQDCFTQGEGEPIGWLPLHGELSAPAVAAMGGGAYPTGSDREVLLYLMQQFDGESWYCERCGHSEDTATMDSADYLRRYLAEHPTPPAGGFVVEAYRDALQRVKTVMGPVVPKCCQGCEWEWAEALSIVDAALSAPTAQPSAKDGVRGGVCYGCGASGHSRADCPSTDYGDGPLSAGDLRCM